MPFVPTAYAAVDTTALGNVLNPIISTIVYPIVALMFAVAVVVFAYGVLQMVIKGNDEKARAQGKTAILGGVIGMFIMLSAWGIIHLISSTVAGL